MNPPAWFVKELSKIDPLYRVKYNPVKGRWMVFRVMKNYRQNTPRRILVNKGNGMYQPAEVGETILVLSNENGGYANIDEVGWVALHVLKKIEWMMRHDKGSSKDAIDRAEKKKQWVEREEDEHAMDFGKTLAKIMDNEGGVGTANTPMVYMGG